MNRLFTENFLLEKEQTHRISNKINDIRITEEELFTARRLKKTPW
jgi:hypothetical protein